MSGKTVNLGVVGLGRAFTLMLPTLVRDSRFRLCAAATPGAPGREAFERDFGGRAYDSVEALCEDGEVEAVYIASPHELHRQHIAMAAGAGKHCLVDKPLAISVDEALDIVELVENHGIRLVVGPSHSFDAPVLTARALIESGEFGALRQIQSLNYTDFLYRPRRPAELDTAAGGGVVFSQGIHHMDVARLLAGGLGRSVFALTGCFDPSRPTEGAYSALLEFDDGAFAALTYNGYGHFDSDEFMGWIGEMGHRKDPRGYGAARKLLRDNAGTDEAELKRSRNYGFADTASFTEHLPDSHEHFGLVVASCEHADLRLRPDGVEIFGDQRRLVATPPPRIPRREVMDELYRVIVDGATPLHDARWGLASLEAAEAMLRSAECRGPVPLTLQTALPQAWRALYDLTAGNPQSRPGQAVPTGEKTHGRP